MAIPTAEGEDQMIAANAYGAPASSRFAAAAGVARTCAVRLIDRRTGATHRINGQPLILFTRRPADAVAELLAGRDPLVWEARVEPFDGEVSL